MRFRLGQVRAVDGTVAIDVTVLAELGLKKTIQVRLSADDTRKLIERAQTVLGELGPDASRRLT